jgi:hypothetical protein
VLPEDEEEEDDPPGGGGIGITILIQEANKSAKARIRRVDLLFMDGILPPPITPGRG